jgi:hypothetical protein
MRARINPSLFKIEHPAAAVFQRWGSPDASGPKHAPTGFWARAAYSIPHLAPVPLRQVPSTDDGVPVLRVCCPKRRAGACA